MQPTIVVWWRYGKEHGLPDEFRVNSEALIARHLDQKLAAHQSAVPAARRWWQVSSELIVEQPDPTALFYGPATRIYYLVARGLAVIENIRLRPPDEAWTWYCHLADIFWDTGRQCWVKKDLFVDILVHRDEDRQRIIDLDDLATALHLGLVNTAQAAEVLRRTQATAAAIHRGEFPFTEIVQAREACTELGWQRPR
jgi:hypothetical protein